MNQIQAIKKIEIEVRLRGFSKLTSKMYLLYNQQFFSKYNLQPVQVTEDDIKLYLSDNALSEPPAFVPCIALAIDNVSI